MNINFEELINLPDLNRAEIEDYEEQEILSKEAQAYLNNMPWCEKIVKGWWSIGWGDKIAVLLFKIVPTSGETDEYFWIITGDLPSAYFKATYLKNGIHALKKYSQVMQEWVNAVYKGKDVTNLFPVNVPPEVDYADMLKIRINLINEDILIHYEDILEDYHC